jgi:EAL domain-containing protein (putative c-di-GMP-specific phosphodiesterase class I)
LRHLRLVADHGIVIAIDDYGAGLSSLAYLKQIPASELKIDRMFVDQLSSSNRDPLIVRSTIDLAHALEMEVTAKGVETAAALGLLNVMGCDMVQGFLISRPLDIEKLRIFLGEEQNIPAQLNNPVFTRLATAWKRS